MSDFILDFFITKPHRMVNIGRAGFSAVAFVIVCGLIARVALVGVPAIRVMSGAPAQPTTLQLLYPTLPTWWIPESAMGYAFVAVLAAAFIALAVAGRELQRFINN